MLIVPSAGAVLSIESGSKILSYKTGEPGPAEGFTSYDMGIFSNGWRYLEAAPED